MAQYNPAGGFLLSRARLARLDSPNPTEKKNFGISVGANDTVFVVGAEEPPYGAAYVFRWDTGAFVGELPQKKPESGSGFGRTVVVNGNHAFIAAPLANVSKPSVANAGRVHVFDLQTKTEKDTVLESKNPALLGEFGKSMSSAGTLLVVGAPGEAGGAGAAYLFDSNTLALKKPLVPKDGINGEYGTAVATDGNTIAVGSPRHSVGFIDYAGVVDLFDKNGTWFKRLSLDEKAAAPYDHFGAGLTIAGGTLLVGAPGRDTNANVMGGGVVFQYDAQNGSGAGSEIPNPYPTDHAEFGRAIVGLKDFIAILANPRSSIFATPAAFVDLHAPNGKFIYEMTSTISDPANAYALNTFAFAGPIAVSSGDRIVIGAWAEDVGGFDEAGAVYRFNLNPALLKAPLQPPPLSASAHLPESRPGAFAR